MFLCEKKVVYISLYEQGERIASAGFVSLQGEKNGIRFSIQLKNAGDEWQGTYPIYLLIGEQEINIGQLSATSGCGNYERVFYYKRDKVVFGGVEATPEEIDAVWVRFHENRIAAGEWKHGILQKKYQPMDTVQKEKESEVEKPIALLAPAEELKAVSVSSDKWEQLKRQYKTIHPFGDDREFISIELKDFVILRESCQKLANNSFLLHGFYNYRHLILGKDYQIGGNRDVCFYIGVPGVFFEREKMVAVMFGFEGFESAGPVEIGKFGYYLRRVEI